MWVFKSCLITNLNITLYNASLQERYMKFRLNYDFMFPFIGYMCILWMLVSLSTFKALVSQFYKTFYYLCKIFFMKKIGPPKNMYFIFFLQSLSLLLNRSLFLDIVNGLGFVKYKKKNFKSGTCLLKIFNEVFSILESLG